MWIWLRGKQQKKYINVQINNWQKQPDVWSLQKSTHYIIFGTRWNVTSKKVWCVMIPELFPALVSVCVCVCVFCLHVTCIYSKMWWVRWVFWGVTSGSPGLWVQLPLLWEAADLLERFLKSAHKTPLLHHTRLHGEKNRKIYTQNTRMSFCAFNNHRGWSVFTFRFQNPSSNEPLNFTTHAQNSFFSTIFKTWVPYGYLW